MPAIQTALKRDNKIDQSVLYSVLVANQCISADQDHVSKKDDSITNILKNLHWLPITARIHYKLLLTIYKSLNGLGPSYLKDLLESYQPSRTLRSKNKKLLMEPRTKTKNYGDRAFSVLGPKLWNSIPLSIRNSDSLVSFKKDLKTFLFQSFYL